MKTIKGVSAMKQARKKRVKGMTLIEIIVAMAVLSIIGVMMVRIGTLSNNFLQNSVHVNEKTVVEAPVAAVANPNSSFATQKTDGADADGNVGVVVTAGGSNIQVKAKRYTTSNAADGKEIAKTKGNMHMDFLDVDLTMNKGDNIWEEPTEETT